MQAARSAGEKPNERVIVDQRTRYEGEKLRDERMTKASSQAKLPTPPQAPASPSDTELTDSAPRAMEDIRLEYQIAITAWTYEGTQVWARFNAMLVAHGILIAIIGQFILAGGDANVLVAVLSGLGAIISVLWFSMNVRGFGYHNAFLGAAKKQEQYLSAYHFLEKTKPKLGGWMRPLGEWRIFRVTSSIISLFALVYLGLLIYALLELFGLV